MQNERETDWAKTKKSKDYRSFLKAYLEETGWSLSDFARAAGFGRGFPGDVISGKRGLTAKSYSAFESALKLPLNGRKLFRYLVAREEPKIFPSLNPAKVENLIREMREKHWTRPRKHLSAGSQDQNHVSALLADPNVFAVYAAAGTAEKGAPYETILQRTRLGETEVKTAIANLIKADLLILDGNVYRSVNTHVFLETLGKSESFIRLFQQVSKQAADRVSKALDSDREMFFTSAFCVDEKRLPELKIALRKTMLQFVDESLDSDGGKLVQLVTSMFLP